MLRTIKPLVYLIGLCVYTSVAIAEVTELDAVTVTATRVEKNRDEIPLAISTVEQDDIQLATEQLGLDESLVGIPGVFFFNRYNFAQDLRVSIRGFGARSSFGIRGIKVLVDGIPETLPDGQGSVDGVDIGSAERISVIRGPASSLYGNASGGAILIESEKGPEEPFIETRISGGDYDLNKQQLKFGGDTGRFNYLVNASNTEIDGYRFHSEAENRQINGRFEFTPSDKTSLLATLHYTDQPLANDPGGITAADVAADRRQARDNNVTFDAGESLEQTRAGLVFKNELDAQQKLQTRFYYTTRDFNNRLPFQNGGAVSLDRDFVGGGISYINTGTIGDYQNRLLVGVDYDYQDDERRRFNNMQGVIGAQTLNQNEEVSAVGVYLQNEMQLSNHTELTLGLRYDEVTFDVSDAFLSDGNDSGKVSLDEVSPMIGISTAIAEKSRLYATLSSAFETPTTTEFANPNGGGFNQALKPQTSINYEIGLKSSMGAHHFEAALFHIDVDDELTPFELATQPGRTFFQNAGSSERDGVELSYNGQLAHGFTLSAAYTYSDFTFDRFSDANGGVFDGNQLPGIPESLLHLNVSWFNSAGIYAFLSTTYTGELFANNANTERVDSHTVSNFRLGYNGFVDDWEFSPFIGINNLSDEEYNNNIRINAFGGRFFEPAPDRNVYFGLTIRKNFTG